MYRTTLFLNCIFYLSISLSSCNDPSNTTVPNGFKRTNEYAIHLDEYTSPVEEYTQYLPSWKGHQAMAFHVRKKGEIKIYGLEDGSLLETLSYSQEGPDSYRGIYDFHIYNEDSIFLNKRYLYQTYLVDSKFNKSATYQFLDPEIKLDPISGIAQSDNSFLPVFNHNRIFQKTGNTIYLTGSPDKNSDFPEYFDADCMIVSVDLPSGKVSRLIGYPDRMKGKGWGTMHDGLFADFDTKREQFILSYASDKHLYITDNQLNKMKKFLATPEKFSDIKPLPASYRNNETAYFEFYNKQYVFGSVLYDSFRNVYYRVALEPDPNGIDMYLRDPLYKPRNMVVMAFDSSFEKIAEMRLEQTAAGTYLDRCFVNEKGLNIAYVDLTNEDILYYKTFSLE
ncbi:hypothetical protein DN752_15690 [Echinicola strongylocentroti]|uniref:DUF4221 domain-containing protein n=1 Tax=Echinicola strongylocentroti TaxID=1795355 RepID=A0A2Z4ILK0_9BACT|nr:DUF4221 family protein [Echinicola strongylocentroti]AWW31448.1 hypothetical protein DN752_15690 [Echinicola strongylocentroti]